MDDRQALQKKLEELRDEVGKLPLDAAANRAHIERLLEDIERRLAQPPATAQHDDSLLDGVRAAIRQYEVAYPRATGILNDILVTLANLGI